MKLRILLSVLLATFFLLPAFSQKSENKGNKKYTISGVVTDMNNKPVTGARIFIDSVLSKYSTDEQGKYRLKINPAAKKIFIFSDKIGYAEADINGESTINTILKNNIEDAPAFLVNAKSITAKKEPEPHKINTYTDIYQMIRQEVPGVLVSGKSIVVQQPNSFFGSTTPLFLVNGVRVNSIDYINPVEVKSIKLLKGSNANIYGVEGANGVISITLFSGSEK
jgi:hypothetical protein